MKDHRPKNLNLFTIRFPIPAIVSILHRISGVILFLFIPFLLWVFYTSLSSAENFDVIAGYLSSPFARFVVWGFCSMLIFHLIAGIRHLFLDAGFGEELMTARLTAKLTMIVSIVLIILMGIRLW